MPGNPACRVVDPPKPSSDIFIPRTTVLFCCSDGRMNAGYSLATVISLALAITQADS